MENYADYVFYIDKYEGSLSDDLFNSNIVKASREIDKKVNKVLTLDIINSLTEIEKYQLSYTACLLVDFLSKNSITDLNGSISIDGVSLSGISKQEYKTNIKDIFDNLPDSLTRYI